MGRVGVTRKWRFAGLLLVILLLSATAQAEEIEAEPHRVSLGVGVVSGAQLDRGYSPLIYSGVQGAVEVGYSQGSDGRERSLWLGYSSGAMESRHGRNLESFSLSFLVATMYRLGEESPFYLGWSNDNQFNSRTIGGFLNFTGRSDYFTSFGPAAKYSQGFQLFGQEFSVDVLSHVQLLGFYLPSGYVSSLPRGFGYEPGGFFESFAGSVFLFHPGSAVSAGLRPELQWYWREGTSLAVSYSYEFVALRNVHTSRRSRGHFLLSLRMSL
jgi:hypothetical protein